MENYIVSARKYRPMTFETVVGQKALTQTLQNAIRQNHLAHAYLFCGPRGVGKTTCARIFAKTINCLHPDANADACNECESCKAFNEQRSFNIHELDAASNNSVDDIRALIDQVRIPPQIGKYSVYIIDEVHMLSQGAFNALLKTLEEPPSYAIFILATTEKHKVLPTILSRCQVYDFARMTVADTVAHLMSVAQKEGITVGEESLNVVAQKADGGMRDALSIFDQLVSFCGKEITYERTIEVLNVLNTDYYFRLVDLALQHNVTGALLLLDEVLRKGFDAGHFIVGMAQHLRDVLVAKDPQTIVLMETSDAVRQHYAEQGALCSPIWLFQALEVLNQCDINYRTARNKRLTVELALIKLVNLGNLSMAAPATTTAPASQPMPTKATTPSTPVSSTTIQPASTRPMPSAPITGEAVPKMPTVPKMPVGGTIPTMPNIPTMPAGGGTTTAAPPETAVHQAKREERNSPFTKDRFTDAWVGLYKKFEGEPRLKSLLESYPAKLVEGTKAHMVLPNVFEMDEFKHHLPIVLRELRDVLENDHIEIDLSLAEYKREQMAFTAEEKFRVMAEMNADLLYMKNTLHMQLD